MKRWTQIAAAGFVVLLLIGRGSSQDANRAHNTEGDQPDAEFQMARVKYRTYGGAGSHGIIQPWWAIDYPLAEEHFFAALRRVTNIQVAEDERHLELTDKRIFQYPFLFLQQPGQGNWRPSNEDAANLREYLARGGFLLVDDFHGERDWAIFQAAIKRVLPDREIVE